MIKLSHENKEGGKFKGYVFEYHIFVDICLKLFTCHFDNFSIFIYTYICTSIGYLYISLNIYIVLSITFLKHHSLCFKNMKTMLQKLMK